MRISSTKSSGSSISTVWHLGAYHLVTNYPRVSRISAKNVLSDLLMTRSEALYPETETYLASAALDYAATYRVESWDGYLVALARKFGAKSPFLDGRGAWGESKIAKRTRASGGRKSVHC
jgi:hypothetical protein